MSLAATKTKNDKKIKTSFNNEKVRKNKNTEAIKI